MRYLPAMLAKLWSPAPLLPAKTMNDEAETRVEDPIACAIDAAVRDHERAASFAQDNFARRVRDTLDDLLERMGPQV